MTNALIFRGIGAGVAVAENSWKAEHLKNENLAELSRTKTGHMMRSEGSLAEW